MWQILARLRKDGCAGTRGRLSAYLDGRLSAGDLRRVEQHLAVCHGCQQELRSLEATVALLHRLPQAAPSRSLRIPRMEPSRRWTPVPALRLATAGATMLLILAFTADMVNFFDTPPSPTGQPWGSNYTDNRSAAVEGNDKDYAGTLSPGDGQEPSPSSDEAIGSAEAAWVRPAVYGLAGTVVLLGGITAWLWLKPRRRATHPPA